MRLILLKQVDDRQIGHLYEHMFLSKLSDHLRQHSLFSLLDYQISGEVLSLGYIMLNLQTFNIQAHNAIDSFLSRRFYLTQDLIASSILQIFAEKITTTDGLSANYRAELARLHQSPWLNLKQIQRLEARQLTDDNFLNFRSTDLDDFWTIEVKLTYDSDPQLRPLFQIIAKILTNNISQMMESDFHGFTLKTSSWTEQTISYDCSIYRRSKRQDFKPDDEIKAIKNILRSFNRESVLKRLIHELETTANPPIVSTMELVEANQAIIDHRRLFELASIDNLRQVIRLIQINISEQKPKPKTIDSLQNLSLPSGVDAEIKMGATE